MGAAGSKDLSFASLPLVAKAFVLLLVLAVLTVVYYLALHMSLSEDIESAEAKHTQLEEDLRDAQERQQEYLRLTQELANREAVDRRNKRALPEEAEIAAFLQDLNRLAELSGLRIRMVEPRPEEAQELLVRIPVSLSLTGRYHQLMKFFHETSQLDRAINMENITLTNPRREEEGEGELVVDAHVTATTFRRPRAGEGQASEGGGDDEGSGRGSGGSG